MARIPYSIETGVILTPAKALKWLETMNFNRPVTQLTVKEYAGYMKNGTWCEKNAETMKFDWNGEFADGQNRAWAVIESGKTIKVDVAYGLDPKSIKSVDQGKLRSYGDTIVMETKRKGQKVICANNIGRALCFILAYERGNIYERPRPYPNNAEIFKAYEEHPDLIQSAEKVCKRGAGASPSIVTALHYIFSRTVAHKEMADQFFESLRSGANLSPGSPILTLRNKLTAVKNNGQASLSSKFALACIIRAWEAYKRGETLKNIVYNTDSLPQITKKTREPAVEAAVPA